MWLYELCMVSYWFAVLAGPSCALLCCVLWLVLHAVGILCSVCYAVLRCTVLCCVALLCAVCYLLHSAVCFFCMLWCVPRCAAALCPCGGHVLCCTAVLQVYVCMCVMLCCALVCAGVLCTHGLCSAVCCDGRKRLGCEPNNED